jgi:hypothetical protein
VADAADAASEFAVNHVLTSPDHLLELVSTKHLQGLATKSK